MFVQIIRAKAKDPAGVRKMWEKAQQELAPGAIGFLGATGGIADDGTSIAAARFESEGSARQNSARPEQDAWAKEMQHYVEPPIQYVDCTEVSVYGPGGSDDAGFVQIIQARTADRDRLGELEKQFETLMRDVRPDVIGGYTAWHPGDTGWFTSVNYFTSEAEAREGERKELPADMKPVWDEWVSLMQDVEYIDLHEPWMWSR
jgi:hypothetical protein